MRKMIVKHKFKVETELLTSQENTIIVDEKNCLGNEARKLSEEEKGSSITEKEAL